MPDEEAVMEIGFAAFNFDGEKQANQTLERLDRLDEKYLRSYPAGTPASIG